MVDVACPVCGFPAFTAKWDDGPLGLVIEGVGDTLHPSGSLRVGTPESLASLPSDMLTVGGRPYMKRYYLYGWNGAARRRPGRRRPDHLSVRLHHILLSDPGRALHDHPWDFLSTMLSGRYTETTPHGVSTYEAPCQVFRKAESLHRLTLDEPVWTLVATGPPRRQWGFQTESGWVNWRSYERDGAHADHDRAGTWG